jgi:hypothetical protein
LLLALKFVRILLILVMVMINESVVFSMRVCEQEQEGRTVLLMKGLNQ